MPARKKKTSASKTVAKKASAKKSTASKTVAKKAPTKKRVKARTAKVAAKTLTAKRPKAKKKSAVRPKVAAKTGAARVARTARKAPIARKKAPKSDVTTMREAEPVEVADATTEALGHFEISREGARGGLHDGANHSKPQVQLQRQHIQVTRSPERHHTMRGH